MKKSGLPRMDANVSHKYHMSLFAIVLQRYRFTDWDELAHVEAVA